MSEQDNAVQSTEAEAQDSTGRAVQYFFKKSKVKDESGNVIGESRKHPTVEAVFQEPTTEDIIAYLNEGGKVAEMIRDGIFDLIFQAGRNQINDWLENNPEGTFTANDFDMSKLTLDYIANLPKASRGAWAPSEDELASFCDDYTNVMVHEVQYEPKRIKLHVDLFKKGMAKLRNDKAAVQKMKDFLTLYASKTSAMEDNEQVYGWLNSKADKYLAAEEKNFADAL